MRVRKKPVEVDAWFIKDLYKDNWANVDNVIKDAWDRELLMFHETHLSIKTLEGEMIGQKTDYLIMGVNGEFYPCKPDIFEKTYEVVE
jgi:hypothetical protein